VFNMVNALLLRVHQSGHLAELTPSRRALVKEALDYYKRIRRDIPQSLPFWPLGLPTPQDGWICLGLRAPGERNYLAVWRTLSADAEQAIPLPRWARRSASVRAGYPRKTDARWRWDAPAGTLTVGLPEPKSAVLLELHFD
jgi:alpha-galactosidase